MENQSLSTSSFVPLPSDRILVVDALRGFALLGILLVHISMFFFAGYPPKPLQEVFNQGLVNQIVLGFSNIFVEGKFYTIFSFLFGLSFAIQLFRAKEKKGSFLSRYAWRLVILGVIGFVHQLVWRGDILMIYALLGFVLLLFTNASNKVVLVAGLLLIVNVPSLVQHVYENLRAPEKAAQQQGPPKEMEAEAEKYYQLVKQGSPQQIARANIKELKGKADFQLGSGRIYITLGCFLLGLYAGRRRFFHALSEHRLFFKKLFRYSGFSVLGIIAVAGATFFAFHQNSNPPPAVMLLLMTLYYASTAALTFFYMAGVTLLLQRQRWQGVLRSLAPVGRMGLTNYVLQSVMGTLIFYGYGLGLIGKLQTYQAMLLTIPLFLLQVAYSQWWLARFQYGPLEWLWRSLTYLKRQPLRIKSLVMS